MFLFLANNLSGLNVSYEEPKGSGEVVLEWFIDKDGKPRIDGLIKLIFFFLGTSKEKRMDNTDVASDGVEILKKLNVPVFSPVSSYYKTIEK